MVATDMKRRKQLPQTIKDSDYKGMGGDITET